MNGVEKKKYFVLGRQELQRQEKHLLVGHVRPIERTTEGPPSYVLLESPFASVSAVSISHSSLVSLPPSYRPSPPAIFYSTDLCPGLLPPSSFHHDPDQSSIYWCIQYTFRQLAAFCSPPDCVTQGILCWQIVFRMRANSKVPFTWFFKKVCTTECNCRVHVMSGSRIVFFWTGNCSRDFVILILVLIGESNSFSSAVRNITHISSLALMFKKHTLKTPL